MSPVEIAQFRNRRGRAGEAPAHARPRIDRSGAAAKRPRATAADALPVARQALAHRRAARHLQDVAEHLQLVALVTGGVEFERHDVSAAFLVAADLADRASVTRLQPTDAAQIVSERAQGAERLGLLAGV